MKLQDKRNEMKRKKKEKKRKGKLKEQRKNTKYKWKCYKDKINLPRYMNSLKK